MEIKKGPTDRRPWLGENHVSEDAEQSPHEDGAGPRVLGLSILYRRSGLGADGLNPSTSELVTASTPLLRANRLGFF